MKTEHFLILLAGAVVAAVIARIIRARMRAAPKIGDHDVLMKRAEAHVEKSAFLKKASADYRKTGHLSARQVEAVENALARLETAKHT
jgi:hypothetical protein